MKYFNKATFLIFVLFLTGGFVKEAVSEGYEKEITLEVKYYFTLPQQNKEPCFIFQLNKPKDWKYRHHFTGESLLHKCQVVLPKHTFIENFKSCKLNYQHAKNTSEGYCKAYWTEDDEKVVFEAGVSSVVLESGKGLPTVACVWQCIATRKALAW